MKTATWAGELAFVWLVLTCVQLATGFQHVEAIGSLAVLASFAHAQVSDRMAEREGQRAKPDVHCYRWALRYFVTKELLWLVYFAAHRSWSALVGVGVFLLYPIWRRWYRRLRPLAL